MVRVPLLVAAVAATVLTTPMAAADPGQPPSPNPVTTAPVKDINAPVVDIHSGTETVDGATSVEDTRRGAKARLDSTVLFSKDSAVLRSGARKRLAVVAEQLKGYGPGRVDVVGYTDDLGSARHGLDLSRRRARAVTAVLRDELPSGYPIEATGKGERDPAVPNTSEANRRKNRRVVITLARAAAAATPPVRSHSAPTSDPNPEPTSSPSGTPSEPPPPTAATSAAASESGPSSVAPSASAASGPTVPGPAPSASNRPTEPASFLWFGLAGLAGLLLGVAGLRQYRARARTTGPAAAAPAPLPDSPSTPGITAVRSESDLEFLRAALLMLARSQSAGSKPMPEVAAAELRDGDLRLHLSTPCRLDQPWQGAPDLTCWTLAREVDLNPTDALDTGLPCPYPLLVSVGDSHGGEGWMLNLEQLGFLHITGDHDRAQDLVRHLVAEVALNPLSTPVRLDCIDVASELATMNPDRVKTHSPGHDVIADAITGAAQLAQQVTAAGMNITTARAGSTDPARWPARALFVDVTRRRPELLAELSALITGEPGRTGTALVVLDDQPGPDGGVSLTMTSDGRLQLHDADLDLVAPQLSNADAAGCASLVAQGREEDADACDARNGFSSRFAQAGRTQQVTPALHHGVEEGATNGTSLGDPETPATPLHRSGRADIGFVDGVEVQWSPSRHGLPSVAPAAPGALQGLDADVRVWAAQSCDLPRLTLLGPVGARAHGTAIARRMPYYVELLTFLALRPHGSTPEEVADAFSITTARARNDVKIIRDWLGVNPRTGRKHLPDARNNAAARARGIGVYQVEGLLVDLDLFRQLRARGESRGASGLTDLQQALGLVSGQPFDKLRPGGWTWMYEGDRIDQHAVRGIVDVAHRVARESLRTGDRAAARAAAEAAALAAPYEDAVRQHLKSPAGSR